MVGVPLALASGGVSAGTFSRLCAAVPVEVIEHVAFRWVAWVDVFWWELVEPVEESL